MTSQVERRDVKGIVRVEDGVVVGAALLDTGLIRQAVFRLTADAVLEGRFVLDDVAGARGINDSRRNAWTRRRSISAQLPRDRLQMRFAAAERRSSKTVLAEAVRRRRL